LTEEPLTSQEGLGSMELVSLLTSGLSAHKYSKTVFISVILYIRCVQRLILDTQVSVVFCEIAWLFTESTPGCAVCHLNEDMRIIM
jgi:hypothetical protein